MRIMKITVSVIKADVGGVGGHTKPSDGLIEAVKNTVKNSADLLIDYYIGYCGDDVHIVMSHTHGVDNQQIHKLSLGCIHGRNTSSKRRRVVWCRTRLA